MIAPPGWDGVAFSEASDGDMRSDEGARSRLSSRMAIDSRWATSNQVHGHRVVAVEAPGPAGDADALWTSRAGLPLAVFTADCFGVVLVAPSAVGVAHVGWRGARSRVVAALREEMAAAGSSPTRAAIGPGIRSCCFEVGPEVAALFAGHQAETSWGTVSVDLPAVIESQLAGLDVWDAAECTLHGPGWFSHRSDRTPQRLATIGWIR